MNPTDRLRSLLSQGRSRDEALGELRRAGTSPIGCIKAIHEAESVGLAEAKRLFSESVSWADVLRSHDQFAEELEALIGDRTEAVTIYVALRDEGVPVWRPVAAAKVDVDAYRILSANSEYPDEVWEFDQGDLVRCADRMLSGANAKVAVARLSSEAG